MQKLRSKSFRLLEKSRNCALLDDRNETIGKKIRESEISKVPYMIIIGEKEEENQTVSLRKHSEGDLGSFTTEKVVNMINKEVKSSLTSFEV